jgi:hypothetical protein
MNYKRKFTKEDKMKYLLDLSIEAIGGHLNSDEEMQEIMKTNFTEKEEVKLLFDSHIMSRWQVYGNEIQQKCLIALEESLANPNFDFQEISDRTALPLEQGYNSRQLFEWLNEYLNEISEEMNGQTR